MTFGLVLVLSTIGARVWEPTTYADDVAPILRAKCVGCHRPAGAAPFSLVEFQDAARRSARIALAAREGRMPPWLPASDGPSFVGARGLTEREIRILELWKEGGAPPGDLESLAPVDLPTDSWDLGEPDLIVPLPPFTLPGGASDVYRNLVVPVPVEGQRWVASAQLRPGSRLVHHARIMVDDTRSSAVLAAEDESGPGFDGMSLESDARNPDGHFVGWTPGRRVLPPLEGMAWSVDSGTDLVAQLHLRPTPTDQLIEAEVGLWFADAPPTRHPVVLVLTSYDIDIPPGESEYAVTTAYTLPVPVELLSVYPHAHYLGKSLRAIAVLPGGREVELIDIPKWDFDWQDDYRYEDPIRLPAGATVVMQYTYDNSADNPNNPSDPPLRVRYGSRAVDEMADLILQVLPRNGTDRTRLVEHQALVHRSQDLQWIASASLSEGRAMLQEGRPGEAVELFQDALQARPDDIEALLLLSQAFGESGDPNAALLIAQRALNVAPAPDPRVVSALAQAWFGKGETDRAVAFGREALRLAEDTGDAVLVALLDERLRSYLGGR